MSDRSNQNDEAIIDGGPAPVRGPDLMGFVDAAQKVVGLIMSFLALGQKSLEAKVLFDKWKKENQLTRVRGWKRVLNLPVSAGDIEIVIGDVDDSADICWNDTYYWTLNRGERRGFKAPLRLGDNAFWFRLNNHGGHRFSLVADISQGGRNIAQAKYQGDDEGWMHLCAVHIVGHPDQRLAEKADEPVKRGTKLSTLLQGFSEVSGSLSVDGKRLAAGDHSNVMDVVAGDAELRRQLEARLREATKQAVFRREMNQDDLQTTTMPMFPAINVDTKVGWVYIDYSSRHPSPSKA